LPLTVAPHAGAWIETGLRHPASLSRWVAPHAGAWIETASTSVSTSQYVCRAPRGRVD